MDRILKLIICSLVMFSGLACNVTNTNEGKTQNTNPIDFSSYSQDSTLIIDSWEWVRTTFYYTSDGKPMVKTPESTNSTQKLVVKKSGEISFYKDNKLLKTQSLSHYLENKSWGVLADTLAISTAYVDGPESVYVRGE